MIKGLVGGLAAGGALAGAAFFGLAVILPLPEPAPQVALTPGQVEPEADAPMALVEAAPQVPEPQVPEPQVSEPELALPEPADAPEADAAEADSLAQDPVENAAVPLAPEPSVAPEPSLEIAPGGVVSADPAPDAAVPAQPDAGGAEAGVAVDLAAGRVVPPDAAAQAGPSLPGDVPGLAPVVSDAPGLRAPGAAAAPETPDQPRAPLALPERNGDGSPQAPAAPSAAPVTDDLADAPLSPSPGTAAVLGDALPRAPASEGSADAPPVPPLAMAAPSPQVPRSPVVAAPVPPVTAPGDAPPVPAAVPSETPGAASVPPMQSAPQAPNGPARPVPAGAEAPAAPDREVPPLAARDTPEAEAEAGAGAEVGAEAGAGAEVGAEAEAEAEAEPRLRPVPGFGTAPGFGAEVAGVRVNRLPTIAPAPGDVAAADPATEAAAEPTEPTDAPDMRPALERHAIAFENPEARPLFSVIILDDEADPMARAAMARLGVPLSFAIDPMRADARVVAEFYRDAGHEVLLLATGIPEGARPSDLETTFASHLAAIPFAVGLIDLPQGGFQGNSLLAQQMVAILAGDGHGLVTYERGLNPADQVAQSAGLGAGRVFRVLDEGDEAPPVIRRYLDRAAFKAAQDGRVIVLGRSRGDTIAALMEWRLEGRAGAVALAPISAALRR